jgi:hypothetical protein
MSTATAPALQGETTGFQPKAILDAVVAGTACESTASDISQSQQRLKRVKEMWARSQKDQLELGHLLYEERAERMSVGGRGVEGGFQSWLREAGIPIKSAYRRITEYEISIGIRVEKPVSPDTPLADSETVVERAVNSASKEALYRLRAAIDHRLKPSTWNNLVEPVDDEPTFDEVPEPRDRSQTMSEFVQRLTTRVVQLRRALSRVSSPSPLWNEVPDEMQRLADEFQKLKEEIALAPTAAKAAKVGAGPH